MVKWILHKDPISGSEENIKLLEPYKNVVDTIEEIDTNPYMLTTHNVNDYVLRRYPTSTIGGGVIRINTGPGGEDLILS